VSTPAASLLAKSDEFLLSAGKAWKLIKETKEKAEPFSKASDAFEMAGRASRGELGAYTEGVEKLRVFVANQNDKLTELAREDENYWMGRSEANVFDKTAMSKARIYLDQWYTSFSQLRMLIPQFLPAIQAAQSVFSSSAYVAARSALEESSLPALDGVALEQVVGNLNNSMRSLDLILKRLRNCRTAL
jgi:hypothetical protein